MTCIDYKSDDSVIATGSTDGFVKLVNAVTGKVINSIQCGLKIVGGSVGTAEKDKEEADVSIESVAFCQALPLLATATVTGFIEVWEVSSQVRRTQMFNKGGISKILWSCADPYLLFAAGLDGSLTTWDGRTGQLLVTRYGHRDQILDFDVSKDGNIIVTASDDTSCRVYENKAA